MNTTNISLPSKLKEQASELVKSGYFSSFSDLVRAALREYLEKTKYDLMAESAVKEYKAGKSAFIAREPGDIDKYMDSLTESLK